MQIIVDFESKRVEIPYLNCEDWERMPHKAKENLVLLHLKEQIQDTLTIENWEIADE